MARVPDEYVISPTYDSVSWRLQSYPVLHCTGCGGELLQAAVDMAGVGNLADAGAEKHEVEAQPLWLQCAVL